MIGLSRTALVTKVNGVRLKATATHIKRGIVVVSNSDGTFNREVALSAAQVATLQASANGVPPGVTLAEWTEGRAICRSDVDIGDVMELPNGTLQFIYAERTPAGQPSATSRLILLPADYTGTPPNITVSAAVLATLQSVHKPISLQGGVLI